MELEDLLRDQDGVVSRAQVLACGEVPHDIRRRLRRREWATMIDGIYVDHTGEPSWDQRAMAGVLHAASALDEQHRPVGAALGGHAALRHAIGPGWRRGNDAPVVVCIGDRRSVRKVNGYRFVRVSGLAARVDLMRTPPRLRPEEATVDLVLAADDLLDVVGVVADACQSRAVDATQVMAALARRPRVAERQELAAVLADVATGTCSAMERLFLMRVVRAHGLPEPTRQAPRVVGEDGGRREYRDAEWEEERVVVELDGRAFHDHARQRDRDLERDLDDVVSGHTTVRLGWGQVSRRACRTARRLERMLGDRGWEGSGHACPECQ